MYALQRIVFAITTFTTFVSAAFSPASKNNVITYWGQGPYQQRLVEICKNPSIDVINVAFVNVFPDQGATGWPGTNFGNQCWGDVYQNGGVDSQLLKTCPYIADDVIACQQTYGKKIFLSIGGGNPNNYYIKNNASGKKFAEFLWAAFGPVSATQSTVPRPWGNATVDGFDFDIENFIDPAPQSNYQTSGVVTMVNHLKNDLFPTDTSKSYYISGAPQCLVPDSHFTTVLKNAWFDFMFIQFYNTAKCSARAAVNKANGQGTDDISFPSWVASTSKNTNLRMSIGLPASTDAANDPSYYLTPAEVQPLVKRFYSQSLFGGIMLWEATYGQNNTICTSDYPTWMKKIVNARAKGKNVVTTCSTKRGIPDGYEVDDNESSYSAPASSDPASYSATNSTSDPSAYPTSYSPSYSTSQLVPSGSASAFPYDDSAYPSNSVCKATSTLIYRSSTEYQTYYANATPASYAPEGSGTSCANDATVTVTGKNYVTVTYGAENTPSAPASATAYSVSTESTPTAAPEAPQYSTGPSESAPESTYTSVNVVTVSPVAASPSGYAPYATGASGIAAPSGTGAWGLSSAYPVPATGEASISKRCGAVGIVFAGIIAAFLL